MMEEEAMKDRGNNRKPHWLCEGLIVKVTNRALSEKGHYNKKGIIRKVLGEYYGEIEMLDDHQPLHRLHQDDLETVIPCIGGVVRIVNGPYRGFNARLLAVDTGNFCAKVQLLDTCCAYQGWVLPEMAYDDICKLNC
ncbi:unnamed protein product [Cuscuta campestris]|uniref:Uncharacterized protein n=1 Tax=Cuscuta campestris TaxID=132261 RepID=A0A484K2R5_9ASTE|nr:unnamed protein product [Cuscuta campestris]